MPKDYGYSTGGKHDGKGLGPYDTGAKATVDVSYKGAGMGNSYDSPNNKDAAIPGGKGSKGGRSSSTPAKG